MPYSSSSPRIADSSSPVSAFSARCDWKSTIVAAMSASAPNSPKMALSRTCGRPVNSVGVDEGEPDDPVDHVPKAGVRRQGAREHLDQAPGRQNADHPPGDQHRGRLEQGGLADLGPELPIGQDQEHDRRRCAPQNRGSRRRTRPRCCPPAAISAAFSPAARIMLPSSSTQAMRLRAVRAAASNASTNDQAMLVSGKLNR